MPGGRSLPRNLISRSAPRSLYVRGEAFWHAAGSERGERPRPVLLASRDRGEVRAFWYGTSSDVPLGVAQKPFPYAHESALRQGRGYFKPFDLGSAMRGQLADPSGVCSDARILKTLTDRLGRIVLGGTFTESELSSEHRARAQKKDAAFQRLRFGEIVEITLDGTDERALVLVVSHEDFHAVHPFATFLAMPVTTGGNSPSGPDSISFEFAPDDGPAVTAHVHEAFVSALNGPVPGVSGVAWARITRTYPPVPEGPRNEIARHLIDRFLLDAPSMTKPPAKPEGESISTPAASNTVPPELGAWARLVAANRSAIEAQDAAWTSGIEDRSGSALWQAFDAVRRLVREVAESPGRLLPALAPAPLRSPVLEPQTIELAPGGEDTSSLRARVQVSTRVHWTLRNPGPDPVYLVSIEHRPDGTVVYEPERDLAQAPLLPPDGTHTYTVLARTVGTTERVVMALLRQPEGLSERLLTEPEALTEYGVVATTDLVLDAMP